MANRNNLYKLDMLILSILAKHDCYGYQLTQIMKKSIRRNYKVAGFFSISDFVSNDQ